MAPATPKTALACVIPAPLRVTGPTPRAQLAIPSTVGQTAPLPVLCSMGSRVVGMEPASMASAPATQTTATRTATSPLPVVRDAMLDSGVLPATTRAPEATEASHAQTTVYVLMGPSATASAPATLDTGVPVVT